MSNALEMMTYIESIVPQELRFLYGWNATHLMAWQFFLEIQNLDIINNGELVEIIINLISAHA